MEKIKKALERARSTRASSINTVNDNSPKNDNKRSILDKIRYTYTKVVSQDIQDLREKRVIIGDTNDFMLDHYKVLRTQVIQRMKTNDWSTFAITSPTENCGKTLTSINLCISLARDVNHSVLLVDLDLRRPNIHTYFKVDSEYGINNYLLGDAKLTDILFTPEIDRLVILPGKDIIENSSELLSSPDMVMLVDELKNRYPERIVVFDMPPLLSCDDMLAFSPYVDAILLVIEDGVTQKNDLKKSYKLLENNNILGVVLNKSKEITKISGYKKPN